MCKDILRRKGFSVRRMFADIFISAVLISVDPENHPGSNQKDRYNNAFADRESTIAERRRMQAGRLRFKSALIVRTPFPTTRASSRGIWSERTQNRTCRRISRPMRWNLSSGAGLMHLLVDLPSIDRMFDDGKLLNHRIFLERRAGQF